MPSSSTASLCVARRRSTVSGRPMSLFRLPPVARRCSSPTAAAKIAAIISLTVVLPLLPVTATAGSVNWRRQPAPSSPSARRVSGATMAGTPASTSRLTSTAAAPRATTSAMKSCASKRSPLRATNRSPGSTLRLSVCTRENFTAPSPQTRAPAIQPAACCKVVIGVWLMPILHGWQAPVVRVRDRRTGACGPGSPGWPHGPCPPPAPRRPVPRA
ncbi:hypothetical protein D9M72_502310 [compost metagenome]